MILGLMIYLVKISYSLFEKNSIWFGERFKENIIILLSLKKEKNRNLKLNYKYYIILVVDSLIIQKFSLQT